MKTASIASVAALAGTIILAAGSCTLTTTPTESTVDNGGPGERRGTDAGTTEEAGADAGPPQPGQNAQQPRQNETLATFSAPEVMNILDVINLGETAQGQLAEVQATNADVKAYATRMVREHQQAQQRAQKLLGATAQAESLQSRIARDPTASVMARQDQVLNTDLKAQTGTAFDLAYMTAEITGHAKVIALIDRALLPSALAAESQATGQGSSQGGAQDSGLGGTQETTQGGSQAGAREGTEGAGLRTELQSMRSAVATHLVDALRIQKAIRSTPPGATPPPATQPSPAAANP